MKIISGSLKGRSLLTTDDNSYRPTTGRVKEAVFSVLSSGQFAGILKDAVTIDLFGGTGALTFEAISRGAAKGIIIENNAQNLKTLDLNAKRLGIQNQVHIIKGNAANLPVAPSYANNKCTIAFIDPPFDKNLIVGPIEELSRKAWLADSAIIVVESHEKESYELGPSYELIFTRKYGKAILHIYNFPLHKT
jgi:16S rRNA (guanine966-N2)-methyltransferase